MGVWSVHVEFEGVDVGTIAGAVIESYSFHDGFRHGEGTFTNKVDNPDAIALLPLDGDLLARRIVFYEDAEERWRGCLPVIEGSIGGDQNVTVRAKTYEAFLERRFTGWAELTNLLENGDLDDWTAGVPDSWFWFDDGGGTLAEVAAIVSGTSAAEITGGTLAPDLLLAELVVEEDGNPANVHTTPYYSDELLQVGNRVRVAIDLMSAANVNWIGKARLYGFGGDFLEQQEPTGFDTQFVPGSAAVLAVYGKVTATDKIVWDKASVSFSDSITVLYNGGDGEDVAVLVQHLGEAAQTLPWSDLGIGFDCPSTGLMAIPGDTLAGFEAANHEWIADCIRQLIKVYGIDVWIDDTLRCRAKRGNRRDDLAVTIDMDDPVSLRQLTGKVTFDPSQGANVAIVTGQSFLHAADEAGVFDSSALGGVSLARKETMGESFMPRDLDLRAAQIVARESVVPVLPDLLIPLNAGDGPVGIGDVIPVTVTYGIFTFSADYRVTDIPRVTPRALMGVGVQQVTVDADDGVPLDSEGS